MLLYGIWGFLGKLAQVRGLSSHHEMLLNKVGFFAGLLAILSRPGGQSSGSSSGPSSEGGSISSRPPIAILLSLLSGLSASLGSLFYTNAMAEGESTAVAAITASYSPVNLVLGALFL